MDFWKSPSVQLSVWRKFNRRVYRLRIPLPNRTLAAGNEWDSEQGLKHIFIAITLGLITSLIGYLSMLVAPFPGFQQLALFSSIGLIAAYITVVAWYPILARNPSRSISNLPGQSLLAKWLTLWNQPRIKVGLPMLCVVVSGFFLLQLNYDDDIRLLQTMPNDLKQQETLITTLSGMQSSQQMLVITADDDENLMKKLESLTPALETWKTDSTIESYQSLSRYLSSVERQQQDYQLIRDLYATQSSPLASG